ncbi:MAG: cadherin-like domain-containing protein [Planctomycetes bacterium]|nr:cadherin-like domain-containing protein [Planctomycetota bacterium]
MVVTKWLWRLRVSLAPPRPQSLRRRKRARFSARMATIETLETRAAPSDSIGTLLGLAIAGELLPQAPAEIGPATSGLSSDAAAESTWADELEIDELDELRPEEAEDAGEVSAAVATHPSSAPLLNPSLESPSGLLLDPFSSSRLGSVLDTRLDLAFAPLGAEATARSAATDHALQSPQPSPQPAPISTGQPGPAVSVPAVGPASGSAPPAAPGASLKTDGGETVSGGFSTLSMNSPPDAVDDIAYAGADQSVTIFVMDNDTDPDFDSLTITAVTQPANGTAMNDGLAITYTPNPGFVSGGDSFQYTIDDGFGSTDTATVTISMVQVTDFMVEWQQDDGSWVVVPDGTDVWSHDVLRWTAFYSPSNPPEAVWIDWLATPWEDATDPNALWSVFATSSGDEPAEGNPGAGNWAITPEVYLAPPSQTDFTVRMNQPKNVRDFQIDSIEWATHVNPDGSPSPDAGELQGSGSEWRFFPDASEVGGAARSVVDAVVQITPPLPDIRLFVERYDVDYPTDHNGPIDNDPDPMLSRINEVDNIPSAGNPPAEGLAMGVTDANGQTRAIFTIGELQPGNNWRLAVAGRQAELDPLEPLSVDSSSRLFYDQNRDGFWDGDLAGEPAIDEGGMYRGVLATPSLMLWRKLHVEVDSMGTTEGQVFPGDDEAVADVPDPDTGMVAGAFAAAFIEVLVGSNFDHGGLPFDYHLSGDITMKQRGQANRGLGVSQFYWSAYVEGAYEPHPSEDADPNTENYSVGATVPPIGEPQYSFIFLETIRDVSDDVHPAWNRVAREQQTVVHEIGHQFGLLHEDGELMAQIDQRTDQTSSFSEDSIVSLRFTIMP